MNISKCVQSTCDTSTRLKSPLNIICRYACVVYHARAQLTTTLTVIVKMEYVNDAQLQLLPNATVQPFPNATLYPAVYPGFILALRICVGTTCVLSIFGGLGIVIAYACFLRPRPDDHLDSAEATRDQLRQILVFLSIADILIAWGHLWGISTYLERLHDVSSQYNTSVPSSDCSVQAVITIYGTIASFMWTVILTMLVFVLIKHQQKEKVKRYFGRKAFTIYHLLCWLVPLIEICIMARLNLLGYDTVDIGEYPNNGIFIYIICIFPCAEAEEVGSK